MDLATPILSQLLPQKESNAKSLRKTISSNEGNFIGPSALVQCRTAKDLKDITQDLNAVTNHIQQRQDTPKNDCFSIQGEDSSDHAVSSLAMSTPTLLKVVQWATTNTTGKFPCI